MLGATIHDVAQVVGAGYAVSEPVGNTAVIVKLFRVFLLLPVVLAIGWLFARRAVAADAAKIPFPMFALVFVLLCVAQQRRAGDPGDRAVFALLKAPLVEASTWGLLIAIGALGLGTSLPAIAALGWRHVATVTGTTVVILVVVTGGTDAAAVSDSPPSRIAVRDAGSSRIARRAPAPMIVLGADARQARRASHTTAPSLSTPYCTVGGAAVGSSRLPVDDGDLVAVELDRSSGVPQSLQKPRCARFELLNTAGAPRVQLQILLLARARTP